MAKQATNVHNLAVVHQNVDALRMEHMKLIYICICIYICIYIYIYIYI